MKQTIQEQLNKRKYKPMSRACYWLYHFVMAKIVLRKYKPEIIRIDDIRKEKEPCFIVFNHLSRLDHLYVLESTYPKSYNMMTAYNEFFRSHLKFTFKISKVIPKKQFTPDMLAIKAVSKVFSKGGSIAIAPEGIATMYGESHPIIPGTGHLIKKFGYKVYFIELRGQHLTTSWNSPKERIGKTFATTSLLLNKEDVSKMTAEEIDNLINKVTRHDEYAWQKEKQISFSDTHTFYDRLEDMLYKCPKCGHEFRTIGKDNKFICEECGNGFVVDDKYNMIPLNDDAKIFETPTKWVDYERREIIKEIRSNKLFEIRCKVKLGALPKYDALKDMKTTEIVGEGEVIVNHDGFSFVGTKNNETFAFTVPYKSIYTLIFTVNSTYFGTYVNSEYYEFYPENKISGKILLAVEELHRFHANIWKNYEDKNYLYE